MSSPDGNLFDAIPTELPEELVQPLLDFGHGKLERIVSHGHRSPPGFWYDQAQGEWVLLAKGEARLEFAAQDGLPGRTVHLKPGDHIDIPPHRQHRVAWTTPEEDTVWLALFYEPSRTPKEPP